MTTETHFFHDTISREWRAPASRADYQRMVAQIQGQIERGVILIDAAKYRTATRGIAMDLLASIGIVDPRPAPTKGRKGQ